MPRDLWAVYNDHEPGSDMRKQIEHALNLPKVLPILSWKSQMELLDNAPEDIIKANLKHLKPETKRKLGLETKKVKTWSARALL
jgi:hypothetical protein